MDRGPVQDWPEEAVFKQDHSWFNTRREESKKDSFAIDLQ